MTNAATERDLRLGEVFTPSAPINRLSLLAGRVRGAALWDGHSVSTPCYEARRDLARADELVSEDWSAFYADAAVVAALNRHYGQCWAEAWRAERDVCGTTDGS